jgi:hypothetical protein
MHIGCNAFCDISANAAVGEALDSLSYGPPLSHEQKAAVAVLKTSHRTYGDGEERPYSTKLPPSHQGRTVELKCGEGFRPTGTRTVLHAMAGVLSGHLDALRQAIVDRTLEVN